jgi:hypothetical protein
MASNTLIAFLLYAPKGMGSSHKESFLCEVRVRKAACDVKEFLSLPAMKIQREWGGDVSGLEVVWIERAKQKGTKGRCPMDWS